MGDTKEEHSILFVNCKVWQPNGTFARCFGIRNNVFDFVSSETADDTVKSHYQKIIDLDNNLVIPGFHDSHCHFVSGSISKSQLDCSDIFNTKQLLQKVSEHKNKNTTATWIIGTNFNSNKFIDRLDTSTLDSAEADLPLILQNYDYHSAFCNSSALKYSELYLRRNEFNQSELLVDEKGELTGVVKEKSLNYLLTKIPEPSKSELSEAVIKMQHIIHSYGITSITDISKEDDLYLYKKLYSDNKLKLRINSFLPIAEYNHWKHHLSITKDIHPDIFRVKGYKAFYDGALGSKTALFSAVYNKTNSNGYRTDIASDNILLNLMLETDKLNLQCAVHAIGDLAVSEVLGLCEKVLSINGKRDRRFRIEHVQHINEHDFGIFDKYKIIASVQPIHLKYDYDIVLKSLPEIIINRTHNYKELTRRDIPVCFGTDFPIASINPFENIQMALTRKINEYKFLEKYKYTLNECISSYTYYPAYATFNENKLGLIKKGYIADFAVVDNIFNMNEDMVHNTKVYKTFLNGEEVYSS